MNTPETAEFQCGLEGTDVTLDSPSHQTWVIDKKLSERREWMTQQEVTDGLGLPFAAAKFLCHRKENPSKKAFMRIYLQIPVIGTIYQSPQIRRKEAAQPQPHRELTTLKALKELECDVVPDLLAYQEGEQGEDSIVPGGYITYVVWDKVPGEPLDAEEFWKLDLGSRQAIRDKFREAYPKLRKCGYLPRMSTMSKIIYDKATGNMHFSGFSRAGRTDTNEEWHDKYYVLFHLAKPSRKPYWDEDTTGWTCSAVLKTPIIAAGTSPRPEDDDCIAELDPRLELLPGSSSIACTTYESPRAARNCTVASLDGAWRTSSEGSEQSTAFVDVFSQQAMYLCPKLTTSWHTGWIGQCLIGGSSAAGAGVECGHSVDAQPRDGCANKPGSAPGYDISINIIQSRSRQVINMNRPKASEEAAPAYHELFDTESITQPAATSSRTHQYASVPQNDLDENANTASHHDVESHPQDSSNPLAQPDPTKPHFHCETCDRQLDRRERREKESECCRLVALVFIVAIIFLALLGIVEQHGQQEQHEQQPEVTPQESAQPQPRFKDGERERVEDYVDEERKLL
ncbi:hypothetical protein CFD26_106189 [Aspergillus turcosus]|uniref:Uncharacterized protein n=1 Tax=Aspergillus turcosus TaxID=1245748 RepID=A0A421D6M6_9EURO|nr:hypothetical protein CFD26_106189 [Aspergillus turcosus]